MIRTYFDINYQGNRGMKGVPGGVILTGGLTSGQLYILPIPLSRYMERRSIYTPFFILSMNVHFQDSCKHHNSLNNYTLTASPAGNHQGPEMFQTTELPGVSLKPKKGTPRTWRLITQVYIQHWSTSFILHKPLKTKHGLHRLIKCTW